MTKQIISTKNAPSAIGPYSQGVIVGKLLFTSGQIPLDPATGNLINDDITKATERVMLNIKAILEEGGTNLDNVVKTTVLLKDMNDFDKVNEIYGKFFTVKQPARSCFQVAKLPKDSLIEIEVIATIE
jgi:2-iminobutanoate/2-iminopropanoate deaminase